MYIDNVCRIFPMTVKALSEYGSVLWTKNKEPIIWNIYAEGDGAKMYKSFYDFSKSVFISKTEAEQALAERMKNEP